VHYCGIAVASRYQQLCIIEEMRAPDPPIRLDALFFEPGTVEQVATQLHQLGEVVVAIAAPMTAAADAAVRACDEELRRRGVRPQPPLDSGRRLFEELADLGLFQPAGGGVEGGDALGGPVEEGSFRTAPVFETNADGVFCALQGRRLPARRHPLGIRLRIQELIEDHVLDRGGDLWHRRIEEVEAAAAALCAHRYAVGHAWWVGRPAEGVVVLPGSRLPERFATEGVLPAVERVHLPDLA
jgi:predicted nuclease with RNAse H fold